MSLPFVVFILDGTILISPLFTSNSTSLLSPLSSRNNFGMRIPLEFPIEIMVVVISNYIVDTCKVDVKVNLVIAIPDITLLVDKFSD